MTSSDKNLSCVLHKIMDIRMEERPIPTPGPGEVQLKMHSCGICGSDVHYWTHGRIGHFVLEAPMLLGHESSGIVSALGEGVKHLKVGDRVAIEPGVPCRTCNYCKTGQYNLCQGVKFLATPPYDGSLTRFHVHAADFCFKVAIEPAVPCRICNDCKNGRYNVCQSLRCLGSRSLPMHGSLTRYLVHAADFCFKLPDNMSMEEGALCEPLSVAIHGCRRAGVFIGSSVLICGSGPIGLVSLITAKAMGASKVCMADITESRLEVAKKMGADQTILVQTKDVQALAKQVEESMGSQVDITIECSGAESCVQLGINATKPGGCVVLIGLGPKADMTLPIVNASLREVDIRGVMRYANTYPTAIAMISSGQVDVKPLVTHRFPLEKSQEAFEAARTGADNVIKVMIGCDQD